MSPTRVLSLAAAVALVVFAVIHSFSSWEFSLLSSIALLLTWFPQEVNDYTQEAGSYWVGLLYTQRFLGILRASRSRPSVNAALDGPANNSNCVIWGGRCSAGRRAASWRLELVETRG